MDLSKRMAVLKAFIASQVSCGPLIQMLQCRALNHRFNNIHEKVKD